MRRPPILLLSVALLLAALACSYEDALDIVEDALEDVPTELTVTKTDDTDDGFCTLDDCSLREAILVANDWPGPDHVDLPAGMYLLTLTGDENLGHLGDLDITGDLVILGAGWGPGGEPQTIVDGISEDRVFEIMPGASVEMRSLQVRHGSYISSGAISNGGSLLLVDVEVIGSHAGLSGGGIGNGGELTLRHTFVSGNSAGENGGGIHNAFGGTVRLESDSFVGGNDAGTYGGGIYTASGVVYLTDSHVVANQSTTGAGLFVFDGSAAQIERTEFRDNDASARGGGIYNQGVVDILSSRFLSNSAYDGGALGNHRDEGGDGMSVYGSTFEANDGYHASAVHTNGALAVRESLFVGNVGQAAIVNDEYFASCGLDGMLLENVTVSGNLPWPGLSGNNAVATACELDVRFSTIVGHEGRGLYAGTGFGTTAPGLEGVLLADNAGGNCNRDFTTAGSNLSSDSTCGFTASTDLSGVDAGLEPLADNGGGTMTHALAPDSAALDRAASADCPPVDQRGVIRPQGAFCDIGAFESEAAAMPRLAITPTPSATLSPTLAPATADVDQNANCRSGPGTVYPAVNSVAAGMSLPILGRDASGQWWVVELGVLECWVTATAVTAVGDVSSVPVWPAPPPPAAADTPEPSATPTFVIIVSVVPKWTPTAIP